jgi:hypothetical protein
MVNNAVLGDASTNMPFFDATPSYAHYDVSNNHHWQTGIKYDDGFGHATSGQFFKIWSVRNAGTNEYTDRSGLRVNRIRALSSGGSIEGNNLRRQITFATSNTAVIDFSRSVTASVQSAERTVTIAAGGLTDADIGERIVITGAGASGADLDSFITNVTSSTTCTIAGPSTITNASVAATIGEDEPDTKYMVTVGCSAQETISVAKATTGITLTSSNGSSTATVDVIIVR